MKKGRHKSTYQIHTICQRFELYLKMLRSIKWKQVTNFGTFLTVFIENSIYHLTKPFAKYLLKVYKKAHSKVMWMATCRGHVNEYLQNRSSSKPFKVRMSKCGLLEAKN